METLQQILAEDSRPNSLGRAAEVVEVVLSNPARLEELFACLFDNDPLLRMRAIDSLEKVCRQHPDWLEPYVERLLGEVAAIKQPSIHWHLAQMFDQISLTESQRQQAIDLLIRNLSDQDVDWIVACNSMDTLSSFAKKGYISASKVVPVVRQKLSHKSKTVAKRAERTLAELGPK